VRIGVLTGGGDCSGMNMSIKWIVKTIQDDQLSVKQGDVPKIIGIKNGWKGLLFTDRTSETIDNNTMILTEDLVRSWDRYGGTYLGTSRLNPLKSNDSVFDIIIHNIKYLGLDSIIVFGGNNTLNIANKLLRRGIKIVAIPKTIDNDVCGTDYCLGFETAVEIITDIVDKLKTTAGSHQRIFIVETMGGFAGWLALRAGESSGAYIILIPEYDFSLERVFELIINGKKNGSLYHIILVSEGAKPVGDQRFIRDYQQDMFNREKFGGISEYLAREIHSALGFETRSLSLGHIQRGGDPVSFDRRMGRNFGIAAANLVNFGEFGKMVSYSEGKIKSIPIPDVSEKLNLVDVNTMYDTVRYNSARILIKPT
jgi:ATP-dependent phosphofructokinase / diphosphate-dependent phosphofructokinase